MPRRALTALLAALAVASASAAGFTVAPHPEQLVALALASAFAAALQLFTGPTPILKKVLELNL